jgi:aryl-alcohol dehydrogenase-like predicted oxidoreductase
MLPVPQRALGSQGLKVSAQGLGCMGMTAFHSGGNSPGQEEKSLETFAKAIELGLNFFDTAWIYQSFGADGKENRTNEELLGKGIKIHGREKFIIATKFGLMPAAGGIATSGKAEDIRSQAADSLQRLGVSYIDLYYQHRMDPSTPIEDTMKCLKEMIQEGSLRTDLSILVKSILLIILFLSTQASSDTWVFQNVHQRN